jgi:hypothetical protein
MRTQGLHRARSRDVRLAQSDFERDGWKVIVLPDGIDSTATFFTAAVAHMPLDPPLSGLDEGRYVWDALRDSLWEGLYNLPDPQIAILWPGAASLARAEPTAHELALSVLDQVSRSLGNREATVGEPKDVAVVVGE